MAIVSEYDWESDTWTHNGDNGARQAWREAVAEIAEKAKAKLPSATAVSIRRSTSCWRRCRAVPDGTAKVASQSNGTTAYHVVNGECSCKDFARRRITSANMCDSFILN